MRGCFYNGFSWGSCWLVFPAYAGMFPAPKRTEAQHRSFPRVCGDVSPPMILQESSTRFSPRMRGCFLRLRRIAQSFFVFPAYAGMFPKRGDVWILGVRFPRVCGDVSQGSPFSTMIRRFSPRMRGCFLDVARWIFRAAVFPAYAGMFLNSSQSSLLTSGFPRVCGDVSPIRIGTF